MFNFDGRSEYHEPVHTKISVGDSCQSEYMMRNSYGRKVYKRIEYMLQYTNYDTGKSCGEIAIDTINKWISENDVFENTAKIKQLDFFPTHNSGSVLIEAYIFEGDE